MKVAINKCYGGFGLSSKAVLRYAKLKDMSLYHDRDSLCDHYYTIPVAEYKRLEAEARASKQYAKMNGAYFSERNIARDDPVLIQVIEELGDKANGAHAEISIVEVPDNVNWQIEEYDGKEWIAEVHRTWS